MSRYSIVLALAALLLGAVPMSYALEVDREVLPRITLGGRVIATVDAVDLESDKDADDEINTEDSALLARFDKKLYRKGIAGAVFGISEYDDEVKLQQLHGYYWNQNYEIKLGRTRLLNTLLELPTLRDDDLLSYTHVLNASSNEEFDQLYGEILSFDWFVDQKVNRLGAWMGTRRNGDGIDAPDGLDSYGVGYVYEQPEDLIYVKRIRHAGVRAERQELEDVSRSEWINAAIAGVELNLTMNPEYNWSAAAQVVVNDGLDDATSLATASDRARAKSQAYVASVRYTSRPRLLTRWQAALTVAYKDYSDVDDATQLSLVPSVAYRLGQGVDVLAQWKYTDYDDGLFDGAEDNVVQLGLAFSFDAMFNDTIGERDSILNLEHGYID